MSQLPITIIVLIFILIPIGSNAQEKKLYEEWDASMFNNQSAEITNDWMPLVPGTRYVYGGTTIDDEEEGPMPHRVIINVTGLTKVINGIKTRVTWDLDYTDGELVESELAFFAQDIEGNVWRMGEFPAEYDEGELAEAPCWLSGINNARAGISMKAYPWLGIPSYSQGWAPDVEFTDRGEITKLGLRVCVPMDCYDNVLEISETDMEEPDAVQLKYWAEGTGNIQVGFKGDDPNQEILQLVDITKLGPEALSEINAKALELEKIAYSFKDSKKVFEKTTPCIIDP